MSSDIVVWKRPQGCTCNYVEKQDTATNELSLVRVEVNTCPLHGVNANRMDEAVKKAMEIVNTTPGGRTINPATLKRIFTAVSPILRGTAPENSKPTNPA